VPALSAISVTDYTRHHHHHPLQYAEILFSSRSSFGQTCARLHFTVFWHGWSNLEVIGDSASFFDSFATIGLLSPSTPRHGGVTKQPLDGSRSGRNNMADSLANLLYGWGLKLPRGSSSHVLHPSDRSRHRDLSVHSSNDLGPWLTDCIYRSSRFAFSCVVLHLQ
jgi:hypothetical protein